MNITALLPPEAIVVRADVQTKEAAIDLLAELHDQVGHLSDRDAYKQDVWKREGECVTAIGMGMAIPHAKSNAVKTPGLAAITVPDGIDCHALDGTPTRLPGRRRPALANFVQPHDPPHGGGAPGTAGAGGHAGGISGGAGSGGSTGVTLQRKREQEWYPDRSRSSIGTVFI